MAKKADGDFCCMMSSDCDPLVLLVLGYWLMMFTCSALKLSRRIEESLSLILSQARDSGAGSTTRADDGIVCV